MSRMWINAVVVPLAAVSDGRSRRQRGIRFTACRIRERDASVTLEFERDASCFTFGTALRDPRGTQHAQSNDRNRHPRGRVAERDRG